jgi:hypothetical protein
MSELGLSFALKLTSGMLTLAVEGVVSVVTAGLLQVI